MDNVLLEIDKLVTITKSEPVNLKVLNGKIICIFGLNGSGKSVLLKTILGIMEKKQGSINFFIDKKEYGVCLQFPEHLIFKETAFDEAMLICDNNEAMAENLLNEINALKDMSPFYLSDGQKRLLFIYGYLEMKKLIFLDEPFVSLDEVSKEKVAEKIINAKKQGKSIIYTANRENDKKIADKIINI